MRHFAETFHDTYGFGYTVAVDALLLVLASVSAPISGLPLEQVPNFPVTWTQDQIFPHELFPDQLFSTTIDSVSRTKIDLATAATAMDDFMKLPEVISQPGMFLIAASLGSLHHNRASSKLHDSTMPHLFQLPPRLE
jgi:hypothetical protein